MQYPVVFNQRLSSPYSNCSSQWQPCPKRRKQTDSSQGSEGNAAGGALI